MVIWLHGTPVPTGFVNGVLRASEVESLRSLEDVRMELSQQQSDILNAAHQQAEEMLGQAQEQAQAMLDDAQAQAQAMLDEMAAHVEQAKREGYDEGRRRNSIEWAERQTRQTQSRGQALQNMHEKLAAIVTSAVERIVHTEPRDALYQRALRSVQTLTRGASQLTLRVGPADYEAAAKAVSDIKGLAANGVQLEVAVDPALKNGSCIFESELGILDASLETQLEGLRNAMGRAVHRALIHADNGFDADTAEEHEQLYGEAEGAGLETGQQTLSDEEPFKVEQHHQEATQAFAEEDDGAQQADEDAGEYDAEEGEEEDSDNYAFEDEEDEEDEEEDDDEFEDFEEDEDNEEDSRQVADA
jgi:type III secretion protein L